MIWNGGLYGGRTSPIDPQQNGLVDQNLTACIKVLNTSLESMSVRISSSPPVSASSLGPATGCRWIRCPKAAFSCVLQTVGRNTHTTWGAVFDVWIFVFVVCTVCFFDVCWLLFCICPTLGGKARRFSTARDGKRWVEKGPCFTHFGGIPGGVGQRANHSV